MGQEVQKVEVGPEQGLRFRLDFIEAADRDAGLAWGLGSVWLGGEPIWYWEAEDDGEPQPLEWTWIDLLEFLGQNWLELRFEESYPFHLTPDDPTYLRAEAAKRWKRLSKERRLEEDEALYRFEGRHDMARAMRGIHLPSIFLMREGQLMWVCSEERKLRLPCKEVLDTLDKLGTHISEHIRNSSDPRARLAVETWDQRRHPVSLERMIELRSSLNQQIRQHIQGTTPPHTFWEIREPEEDNELLAAARMSGGQLGPTDQRTLLQTVRQLPRQQTQQLDELAQEALRELSASAGLGVAMEPFQEGYALARWLRKGLGRLEERVEPEQLLMQWNVQLVDISLAAPQLDAVACWGPRHGPAVLVNAKAARASTPHGRRSSLAHELCHLLVDRQVSLPLAEVLGGHSPSLPEQRANAFAAEFLLPQSIAWRAIQQQTNIQTAVERLCNDYGVGKQIVGWQIQNGGAWNRLDPVQRAYVESLTPPSTDT